MTGSCNNFKEGLRDGIPIGLGYLSVSFTFGMMAVGYGLPAWIAVLISMTNLTSAGQFAGLTLLVSGSGVVEMALTQLTINLRYALMSLSLSQKLDATMTLPHRLLAAFGNTDEIFVTASGKPEKVGRRYLYGLILIPFFSWSGGTLLGALAGNFLPEAVVSALGIAIYGMFIAIVVPPARQNRNVARVLAVAVLCSCLFRWVPVLSGVSSGFVIIICTLIAALLGAWLMPIEEEVAQA